MLRVNHLSGFGRIVPAVGGGGGDSDVDAFMTATGIVDSTIENALDALVTSLKSDGIWTKLLAIYPCVGGDATKHSYNLKNPAAFQITWNGTVTHDANGVTGNGATGYGNTGFNQSTDGADDDEHLSIYSRSDVNANHRSIGVTTAGGDGSYISARQSGFFITRSLSSSGDATANSASLGYFSTNRTANTGYRKRENGTNTAVTQDSDVSPQNLSIYVLAANANGTAINYSPRNYGWFAIGRGLTETEDGNLRTAVETFQDALSRGVV